MAFVSKCSAVLLRVGAMWSHSAADSRSDISTAGVVHYISCPHCLKAVEIHLLTWTGLSSSQRQQQQQQQQQQHQQQEQQHQQQQLLHRDQQAQPRLLQKVLPWSGVAAGSALVPPIQPQRDITVMSTLATDAASGLQLQQHELSQQQQFQKQHRLKDMMAKPRPPSAPQVDCQLWNWNCRQLFLMSDNSLAMRPT